MPIIRRDNGNIMDLVNHLGHYKNYLYVGYYTIDAFNKLPYKDKLLVKDKKDNLYNSGWYPAFVNLKEWESYKTTPKKIKRYKLQRRSDGKKSTIEQKMASSRSKKR